MSLLDSKSVGGGAAGEKVSRSLDTFIYKQMLQSAGLDKGMTGMAGMVFTDVLSEAIAKAQQAPITPAGSFDEGTHQVANKAAHHPGVTSDFGQRVDPFTHHTAEHTGVDVAAAEGTPIHAAWSGVVVQAGERGGYGNAIEVDHGNGIHTLYAHASEVSVRPGDAVSAGAVLGEVGSTGRSTGPHLHLEMRVNGSPVDPRQALKAYGERAEGVK